MKSFIISILISLMFSQAYGTNLIIKYVYEKDGLDQTRHSISDYALGIIRNRWDNVDINNKIEIPKIKKIVVNNEKQEIVIIKYTINTDGAYFIQDSFGHEILFDRSMDNDTITLKLKITTLHKKDSRGIESYYLNDSVKTTKIFVMTYPEKYKYMGFFDSLAYLHGDLMYGGAGYSFKELNHNLLKYLMETNRIYADRIKFYNSFIRNYYMPTSLKYVALKEIQYCYYKDLLEPLLKWNAQLITEYPSELRDSLNKIGENLNAKKLFENTASYRTVVANYVYLGIREPTQNTLRQIPDSLYLLNRLKICKTILSGEMKDYVLAYLMQIIYQQNESNIFNLLYQNYNHKLSTPGVNTLVDSLSNIIHAGIFTPQEILDLSFDDSRHQPHKLGDVLNKEVILIDCWATWCIPCREQMPALDSLTQEYNGRIQFISVSADQFVSKWDAWLTKDNNSSKFITQLHAQNGFENIFFKRLMINAIPRYILISKSGKVLNESMPYPSQKQEFKSELNKYL